jgi:hypothetical protein
VPSNTQIERVSNERISKYQKYAQEMKLKFTEYEKQSETYYAEMLGNFKRHAKDQVTKKQAAIDQLTR